MDGFGSRPWGRKCQVLFSIFLSSLCLSPVASSQYSKALFLIEGGRTHDRPGGVGFLLLRLQREREDGIWGTYPRKGRGGTYAPVPNLLFPRARLRAAAVPSFAFIRMCFFPSLPFPFSPCSPILIYFKVVKGPSPSVLLQPFFSTTPTHTHCPSIIIISIITVIINLLDGVGWALYNCCSLDQVSGGRVAVPRKPCVHLSPKRLQHFSSNFLSWWPAQIISHSLSPCLRNRLPSSTSSTQTLPPKTWIVHHNDHSSSSADLISISSLISNPSGSSWQRPWPLRPPSAFTISNLHKPPSPSQKPHSHSLLLVRRRRW